MNKYIDHTLLKQDASFDAIDQLCLEAKEYDFKSVCVNPHFVKRCVQNLKETNVLVCTVVGFPLGQNTTETKVAETQYAIADGASEIDMVMNLSYLKAGLETEVINEIALVKRACDKATLKVIIETALLNDEQIVKACELAVLGGADFVKTSTGFSTHGATIEAVQLMKESVKDKAKIKASGGISSFETMKAMIESGADRIGTSSGVKIILESKNDII